MILYQEKDRYVLQQEDFRELSDSIAEVPKGGTAVIISHDLDKNYMVLFRNIIVLAAHFQEEDAKQLLGLMARGHEIKFSILDLFFNKPKIMGHFKVLELDLGTVLQNMRQSFQNQMDSIYYNYMLEYEV